MQLLIEAKEIPDGSLVIKKTGSYVYILKKRIKIYSPETEESEIKSQTIEGKDDVFLVNRDGGDISTFSGSTPLLWQISPDDLFEWLNNKLGYND